MRNCKAARRTCHRHGAAACPQATVAECSRTQKLHPAIQLYIPSSFLRLPYESSIDAAVTDLALTRFIMAWMKNFRARFQISPDSWEQQFRPTDILATVRVDGMDVGFCTWTRSWPHYRPCIEPVCLGQLPEFREQQFRPCRAHMHMYIHTHTHTSEVPNAP